MLVGQGLHMALLNLGVIPVPKEVEMMVERMIERASLTLREILRVLYSSHDHEVPADAPSHFLNHGGSWAVCTIYRTHFDSLTQSMKLWLMIVTHRLFVESVETRLH